MWDTFTHFTLLGLCVVLWLAYFESLSTAQKMLGIALAATLVSELFALELMLKAINNLFIFHILVPIQYVFYALVFYFTLSSKGVRSLIIASIGFVLVASVFFTLKVQKIHEYNSYMIIIKHFFMVIWILLYFRQLLIKADVGNLLLEPMFWISTGLLFYSLGNFFIEGYMNYLIRTSMSMAQELYSVTTLLGLFMYALFFVSFLFARTFTDSYSNG